MGAVEVEVAEWWKRNTGVMPKVKACGVVVTKVEEEKTRARVSKCFSAGIKAKNTRRSVRC